MKPRFLLLLLTMPFWAGLLRADLSVASLSTVTADLARNVGGDHVRVVEIISPGTDPHAFEPTPADVRRIVAADLVLCTGKGMEGYLRKLEREAGGSAKFVDVGGSIPSLVSGAGKNAEDPHWWHGVENMMRASDAVADAFAKADPAHAKDYLANAEAYRASLGELQRWIRVKLAELPRNRRKLITTHDSLGYFAAENGFTIHPIKGISTEEEPSSLHVKEIIDLIRSEGVRAVFLEINENPRAMNRISEETGAREGGTLYTDGLGEKEASTYDSMMKHNVTVIVDGLK
jgi:zinc/manganese transport system substrate-binding protein